MLAFAYVSEEQIAFDQESVLELCKHAKAHNEAHGITGYLSWQKGSFFQYFEGPENAVEEHMEALRNDSRHKVLQTVKFSALERRRFARWDLLLSLESSDGNIRIQDLIEDIMSTTLSSSLNEAETRRLLSEMLDKMSALSSKRPEPLRENSGFIDTCDTSDIKMPHFVMVFGASAGGLQPIQSIIKSISPDVNAAFVVIQHFSPKTQTLMDMILQRETKMTVLAAAGDMPIEAQHVYVIPPGENLEIANGMFVLSKQKRTSSVPQFPIDICFRSIAREYGDRAIAVVLSGTGSDGSRGAKLVHDAGGIVLAQSPELAEFAGMPTAVVEADVVHQQLAPVEIAEFINSLSGEYVNDSLALLPKRRKEFVDKVVALLQNNEIDFSQYKNETLFRRIERRRVLANIATVDEYLEYVESSENERAELREYILITVTSFFRDQKAWECLKESLIPLLVACAEEEETFRVWVSACSTGEEAYTVGIVLQELIDELGKRIRYKIYATDIERKALEHASSGGYSERALAQVSESRRERFFSRKADGYVVSREIRKNVIFAPHNFIKNAPFTRMHLVTCRNVLIYMQPELQQIAIKMLHFALNVNGIMFLGPSETLGSLQSEFYPLHREWNQYKKLRNLRLPLHLSTERFRNNAANDRPPVATFKDKHDERTNSLIGLSLDVLSKHTGNTNVLVDGGRDVLMVLSDPLGLMQMHTGKPTLDIAKMVPEGLRASLTFAIARSAKECTSVTHRDLSCTRAGSEERVIDIEIVPHFVEGESSVHCALAVFSESTATTEDEGERTEDQQSEYDQLKDELEETRRALQSAINDLESLNNKQRSINEQLSSANEELQSTNEELQSVNEELYTVNFEYQTKISELSDLNQDLDNLLDSTNLGVIFLDSDLCIRRFTDVATQTVNLLPSDIGRPFLDLSNNLNYKGLHDDMRRVLSLGKSISRDIHQHDVDVLQLTIHPFRAGSGLAQGVLIMLKNITNSATADHVLQEPEAY